MNVRTALQQGTVLLDEARVVAPKLTAEVLLSHALRRDRTYLYAHPEEELTEVAWIHYGRYLHQRLSGVPTQYITKSQEFYGRDFEVTPDVLIPRPETEFVVAAALERARPRDRIIDVGCGSGAIAVTLAAELQGPLWACDVSAPALTVACRNAQRHAAAVNFIRADLLSPMAPGSFDIVASNPPYVGEGEREGLQREVRDHEPHVALFGGETGTEIYARLIDDAARVLRPGGWLILELGYRSLEPVQAMLGAPWIDVEVDSDLAGYPRVLSARLVAR